MATWLCIPSQILRSKQNLRCYGGCSLDVFWIGRSSFYLKKCLILRSPVNTDGRPHPLNPTASLWLLLMTLSAARQRRKAMVLQRQHQAPLRQQI